MDIILNTKFNNPNLPIVPLPGFVDSFNRPAGPDLGNTDDGKPWENHGPPYFITEAGEMARLDGSRAALALVDGMSANGTVSTVIGDVDLAATNRRAGLAVRSIDEDNYVAITAVSTDPRIGIYSRVAGDDVVVYEGLGPELVAGDVLSVTMQGQTIEVYVNGAFAVSADVPVLVNETRHGFYSWHGSYVAFDSIEFTAEG